MSEHSKGPWSFKAGFETTDFFDAKGVKIFRLTHRSKSIRGPDANLLVAAPEMLAALKGILAITDRNHVAWEKARAAIAKAEGSEL